jgi:hypothetical protein
MYQSYSLSRYIDGNDHGTSFTVADDDAINCAHMLAAGFNTISRNTMGDFALGVVDTKAGTVQYDGKIEPLDRPEQTAADPWGTGTLNFEVSPKGASRLFAQSANGDTQWTFVGDVKLDGDAFPASSEYAHIARGVLEDAYTEVGIVRTILEDAGVETIPVSSGVRELQHMLNAREERIRERAQADEAARAEMISFVKRAHAKKLRLQQAITATGEQRNDLDDRWRGMLDTLAKFLVVTGEADASEGHAVARRLCGIEEGAP